MIKWLSNLRMTVKLLVSPAVAILFLFVVWIVCYVGFFNQKAALDDIFNNRFQNYQASAKIIKDLTEVHANVYKLLSMITAGNLKQKTDSFAARQFDKIKEVTGNIETIMKSPQLTKAEKEHFQAAGSQVAQYEKLVKTVIEGAAADMATASILINQADDYFWEINENLNKLVIWKKAGQRPA